MLRKLNHLTQITRQQTSRLSFSKRILPVTQSVFTTESQAFSNWNSYYFAAALGIGVGLYSLQPKNNQTAECSNAALQKSRFVRKQKGKHTDTYKVGKLLGRGAFGEVRVVTDKRTGKERAAKYIQTTGLAPSEKIQMLKEIELLAELDHPNIVRVHEWYEEDNYIVIIMQLCKGGELTDVLLESGLKEKDAAEIMKTILGAINYCHEHGVVHRDIKPSNIIMETAPNDPRKIEISTMKIADFGISGRFNKQGTSESKYMGTTLFVPPEAYEGRQNEKTDIWAVGVTAYLFLLGDFPFKSDDYKEMYKMMHQPLKWTHRFIYLSDEAKSFIEDCLNPNVSIRPSAEEALNHPWIQQKSRKSERITKSDSEEILKNIRRQKARSLIHKAYYENLGANFISKEERARLDKIWKKLDTDNNGHLDRKELKQLFYEKGTMLDDDQFEQVFNQMDLDGNGFIDYTEFIAASMNFEDSLSEQHLEEAFKLFDLEGTGDISAQELKEFFEVNGWGIFNSEEDDMVRQQIDKFIRNADVDGDGQISFDEFKNMMKCQDTAFWGEFEEDNSMSENGTRVLTYLLLFASLGVIGAFGLSQLNKLDE